MLMTFPGRGALVCLCLLLLPLLCFAQTEGDTLSNVASASLERTLSHVIQAEFSPLGPMAAALSADDVMLAQAQGNPPSQTQPAGTNPAAPSLGDLGFPTEQTQGNAQDQARLDRRSHMLKMHQRFGLITIAPLVATIATSSFAGRHGTAAERDLHGALD